MTSPLWNVNAREFTPSTTALSSPAVSPIAKLRVEAPVFVPLMSLKGEVRELIQNAGIAGIPIKDLPQRFLEKHDRILDLSSSPYSDLSVLVASISDVVVVDSETERPKSLSEAMQTAGFLVQQPLEGDMPMSPPLENSSDPEVPLGVDADKVAMMGLYANFEEDLSHFKESILDVAYNFALKNGTHPGLALSLFAAEWDRYHSVRGIPADLRSLRERFGVVKLMPFLQAVPELDVVGTHPEVRVRIKDGMAGRCIAPSPKRRSPASSPDNSLITSSVRNISLSSELFGESLVDQPPITPETQTRTVLEQMLQSTQAQILEILSHVPADPLAAAAAIEKMNELQVLVNALKAALAVLPTPVAKKRPISIESALFGGGPNASTEIPSSTASRRTLNLESMLMDASSSPVTAAASSAAPQVGPLLADLSRILFAQVIQQQQATAPEVAAETNAALEKTLAELVSAASSPPTSPVSFIGGRSEMDNLVTGQLIIPNSLPSSPIALATAPTPVIDDAATMHQLLKGLMSALPPSVVIPAPVCAVPETHVETQRYAKDFLLGVRAAMMEAGELRAPPPEIAGLCCKQVLRTIPPHKTAAAAKVVLD
jgi:hypothetical protein